MTEVKFFFNVEHKLAFACKLARKAVEGGHRLIVFTPDTGLASEFDRLLWTFAAQSFVPHVRAGHALAAETPVIIACDETDLPHHDALINLGDEPPPFFSRFTHLREIVSQQDEDRLRARERLKFYKSRGFHIDTLDTATMTAAKGT